MFAKAFTGLAASFLLLGTDAIGQVALSDPSTTEVAPAVYPGNVWAKGVAPLETEAELAALVEDAISREFSDVMGQSRQIVVIHKGRLVAEAYRAGFAPDTKLLSWSIAKSITQGLVGRAVQEGVVDDIDAPMPSPWRAGDPRSEITWRQWMTMTDGLDYEEILEPDPTKNDAAQMLFGSGRYDVIAYVKDLPHLHEAGTHWNYSSAAFNLLSRAMQQQIGETSMPAWISESLLAPIGMDAQPEFDAAGTFIGGAMVYASARDFARFGYLYLRDGVWNGTRLLPEGWVDFATTAHDGTGTNVYGAGWWITPPEGETPTHPQSAKSAPYDAFHAGGNEGQTIWVVPSKDLVIVRLGLMTNAPENWAALFEWNQKVARAFPDVAVEN